MCDRRVGISGGAYSEMILILELTCSSDSRAKFLYYTFGFGKSARTTLVTAGDM